MALTDVKVRSAKPMDKPYKLTDGEGMHLLVHPNGLNTGDCNIVSMGNKRCWHSVFTRKSRCPKPGSAEMKQNGSGQFH